MFPSNGSIEYRGRHAAVEGFISAAGVIGIALLLPLAIVIVGLPVALVVRALLEAFGWLFGIDVR